VETPEDRIKNEELRSSLAASRNLREAEAKQAETRIAELLAEVERLRERAERAEAALREIRAAQPRWVTGVGSYAGGETWAGFARRLQSLAGPDAAPAGAEAPP
jgi:molecular chaperone GrpE (heat shock protein)